MGKVSSSSPHHSQFCIHPDDITAHETGFEGNSPYSAERVQKGTALESPREIDHAPGKLRDHGAGMESRAFSWPPVRNGCFGSLVSQESEVEGFARYHSPELFCWGLKVDFSRRPLCEKVPEKRLKTSSGD